MLYRLLEREQRHHEQIRYIYQISLIPTWADQPKTPEQSKRDVYCWSLPERSIPALGIDRTNDRERLIVYTKLAAESIQLVANGLVLGDVECSDIVTNINCGANRYETSFKIYIDGKNKRCIVSGCMQESFLNIMQKVQRATQDMISFATYGELTGEQKKKYMSLKQMENLPEIDM